MRCLFAFAMITMISLSACASGASPGLSSAVSPCSLPLKRSVSGPAPATGVGLTWTMLPAGEALPRDASPVTVVSGPAGFVIHDSQHDSLMAGAKPRLWFSPDGRSWTQVPFGSGSWGIRLRGFGWGYVILDGILNTGIWVSTDGQSWCRLGEIPEDGAASIFADTGTRLVAAGEWGTWSAWVSEDGHAWRRSSLVVPAKGGFETIMRVGTGLVALTRDEFGNDATLSEIRVWTSADGLTWTGGSKVPGTAELRLRGIRQAPAGGFAIWMDDPEHSELWSSTDLITWAPASDLGPFGINALGGDGLLVFGVEDAGQDTVRRVVETSSDGRVWRTLPTDAFDSRPYKKVSPGNTTTYKIGMDPGAEDPSAGLRRNAAAWTSDHVVVVGCDARGWSGYAADTCAGTVWVSPAIR